MYYVLISYPGKIIQYNEIYYGIFIEEKHFPTVCLKNGVNNLPCKPSAPAYTFLYLRINNFYMINRINIFK